MTTSNKVFCKDCDWHGVATDLLIAPNPFDSRESIRGCPSCKEIGTIGYACDEDGCWVEATCGFPIDNEYRRTCNKHYDH